MFLYSILHAVSKWLLHAKIFTITKKYIMKKYLILCYSKSGNSKYIAKKLSKELLCDIETIHPLFNNIGFLFLATLLKIPIPTNITSKKINEYNEIILIGPIWGGQLIAPLQTVIKKCISLSKPIHFAVTCETTENDKDKEYGFEQVLKKAIIIGGNLIKTTDAFSTSLVKNYDSNIKKGVTVKTHITDENYSDELEKRLLNFKNGILYSNTPIEHC